MNLPYPFDKASGVRADVHGTISLIDAQGKPLARIPMNTAFELSPEVEGDGYGDGYGYGGGNDDSYGYGFGTGYGQRYGLTDGSGGRR